MLFSLLSTHTQRKIFLCGSYELLEGIISFNKVSSVKGGDEVLKHISLVFGEFSEV